MGAVAEPRGEGLRAAVTLDVPRRAQVSQSSSWSNFWSNVFV